MKKLLSVLVVLIAVISIAGCVGGQAKPQQAELVILHFNDYHAQLEADKDGQGGIAALASVVKETRATNQNVLFVSAGDINTGSMVSDKNDGMPDIEIFNLLKLDATVIGNHEFDKAPAVFAKQIAAAKYPYISANIKKDGKTAFTPYIVKVINGLKVGIFGITTSDTPVKAHPLKVAGYTFTNEIETAKEMVAQLRNVEKVDIVIGLFHVGVGDGAGPNPANKIAEAVSGIDLIIDGHSHTEMKEPLVVNGTPIVQAGYNARYVGRAVISYNKGAVSLKEWKTIPLNIKKDGALVGTAITPDPEVAAMVKKYADAIKAQYNVKIATTTAAFDLGDRLTRKQETPLGNIVADSMVFKARAMGIKADFAFTNGGGIRKSLPAGDVTRMNAYEVLPFGNTLAYFEMTGEQVLELFKNIGAIPLGNGGFANVSKDVRFTLDTINKVAKDITINGQPIDPAKKYIVITNDFIAVGGDGMYPFLKTLTFKDTFIDMLEGFIEYLQSLPQPITPTTDGRITIIK
ncbi:MAG TPA: 5'-nucleotidase C-terminal domain-containing protein [Spirochaetales bacterium]|nr:5'-nucleotidase C-terminal domain-containing protein [Spirochaetales bacterium]HQK35745.1 5'-nucleotidase C-terminal domain-containing protein [Spirochaetales bacterium]